MKKWFLYSLFFACFAVHAQTKLYLDSTLKAAYLAKYPFSEDLTCIPFYCDPFYAKNIKPADTSMCGKFVFVNTAFEVKIRPVFQLPCSFEPKFSESLCAVNINNELVFIDTLGNLKIHTQLAACSPQKNRILPFKNSKAKVYKGSGTPKNYFEIYYLDKNGKRIPQKVFVKFKPKPVLIAVNPNPHNRNPVNNPVHNNNVNNYPADTFVPVFDIPRVTVKNKYHISPEDAALMLKNKPHRDNRMLLFYDCGEYQRENMSDDDTLFCGKFVFVDTLFNVKINAGFELPCAFEPEFAEGLAAVSIDSQIVYIDTIGRVVITTNLASCNKEQNKASTFKNGIATLYHGDMVNPGLYTTIAINTFGERVRLLEFDDLDLAEKQYTKFSNLTLEESANCFVGKGKTNGIWFLIEKSGQVRKKLVLKQ